MHFFLLFLLFSFYSLSSSVLYGTFMKVFLGTVKNVIEETLGYELGGASVEDKICDFLDVVNDLEQVKVISGCCIIPCARAWEIPMRTRLYNPGCSKSVPRLIRWSFFLTENDSNTLTPTLTHAASVNDILHASMSFHTL